MKLQLQLVFVIICISTCKSTNSPKNSDLNNCKDELLKKIETALEQIKRTTFNIIAVRRKLENTKNTLDFGISTNPQIIEIEDTLKKNQQKAKIQSCRSLKETQVNIVKQKLILLLEKQVNVQLKNYHRELIQIKEKLNGISKDLKDQSRIQSCLYTPEKCKIKTEYPNDINASLQKIISIESASNSVINSVLTSSVLPVVSGKILTYIYNPINNCIQNL